MSRLAGAIVSSPDVYLPAPSSAHGNGTNTVTATSWTDLPTTACTIDVENAHPTDDMVVLVEWGGWLHATANGVRICPRVSGSVTIAAGIGSSGPIGWGSVPQTSNSGNPQQKRGSAVYVLPPGTATFTMQAYRDSAAGTQTANYCTLRAIPLRYQP